MQLWGGALLVFLTQIYVNRFALTYNIYINIYFPCLSICPFIPYLEILGSISCFGSRSSSPVSDAFVDKHPLYNRTVPETEFIVNQRIWCVLSKNSLLAYTLPWNNLSLKFHYHFTKILELWNSVLTRHFQSWPGIQPVSNQLSPPCLVWPQTCVGPQISWNVGNDHSTWSTCFNLTNTHGFNTAGPGSIPGICEGRWICGAEVMV